MWNLNGDHVESELSLTNQDENSLITNKPDKKKISKVLIYASAIVAISLFSVLFYLIIQTGNKINNQTKEISDLKKDNESFKNVSKEKDDLSFRLNLLEESNYINILQHRVEGGVVTDNFVVEKFSVTAIPILTDKPEDKGYLTSTIDLITQPGGKSGYTGQGKFSATDRELKSMILDILDKVRSSYNPGKENPYKLPKWEDGSHFVTIKNYEIGTYEKGVFKLKGE